MSILNINESALREHLVAKLNLELQAVAEPLIEKAMEDIRFEMQKRMATFCVAAINHDIDLFRDGHDLMIRIRQASPVFK